MLDSALQVLNEMTNDGGNTTAQAAGFIDQYKDGGQ
jgi:hypothetical protein